MGGALRDLPELHLTDEQMHEPLPLGPEDLRHGHLANGIKYYVRPCNKPKERAALALVVKVGSVVEEESERGVAHILEHLAFNATDDWSNHDIVQLLESVGAEFGPCQNAQTSADETIYELTVPTDDAAILEKCVGVFGQFAFKIRCDPGDLAKERGAVLEEWRSAKNSAGRAAEAHWQLILAGSRYAERLPIGLEKVIRGCTAQTVRAFYDRWYRPENMAVVAAGDFKDPDAVVALLQSAMGSLQPRSPHPPAPIPSFGLAPHAEPRISCFRDVEAQQAALYVSFAQPASPLLSPADFRTFLTAQLLAGCLNNRLFKLSRRRDPPFYTAELSEEQVCKAVQLYSVSAHVPDNGAPRALEAILTELSRARLHGFSTREVDIARAHMLSEAESLLLEKDQAYCQDVRDEYVRHFTGGEFVVRPETEVALYKTLLPGISDADLRSAAAKLQPTCSCVIKTVAHSSRQVGEDTLRAVVSRCDAAEAAGAVPPWQTEHDAPEQLLLRTPVAGTVSSSRWLPAMGATEMVLSNGMRVLHKYTDFLEDQVLLTGFAAGGLSEVPRERLRSAALATTLAGELGAFGHKPHLLPDLLAGKRCEVKVGHSSYWRSFAGEQSPGDLEHALQLVYNLFTHSVVPVEHELQTCMQIAREAMLSQLRNPLQVFSDRVRAVNYGDHWYFQPPRLSDLDVVDPAYACATFNDAFAAPQHFTLCLTGNIKEQALLPLLEQYAAAIPVLEGAPQARDPASLTQIPLAFPPGPVVEEVATPMVMPQACVQITWPVDVPLATGREEVYWLTLCARLLETKLMRVLRFEAGEVYSVSVGPYFGYAGPASRDVIRGEVAVSFTCDPAGASNLAQLALGCCEALQAEGPSAGEVETLLTLEQRAFESQQHENTYWHEVIVGGYQSKTYQMEQDLDRVYQLRLAAREKVVAAAAPDTLRDAFRRLLPHPARSRYTSVTLMPKPPLLQRVVASAAAVRPSTWIMAAAAVGVASYAAVRYWRR